MWLLSVSPKRSVQPRYIASQRIRLDELRKRKSAETNLRTGVLSEVSLSSSPESLAESNQVIEQVRAVIISLPDYQSQHTSAMMNA